MKALAYNAVDISKQNYFELFSLNEAFQLNLEELSQEYKSLQIQYHPDKVVNEDDQTRLQALQITSIVNAAFDTLKTPLKRAAYLLMLHDVNPEENNQTHLGGDFLLRQMTLRDQLEEIAEKEAFTELDKLKVIVNTETDEYFHEFEMCYLRAEYLLAKPLYSKLQFLTKLLREIDSVEEKLLDY